MSPHNYLFPFDNFSALPDLSTLLDDIKLGSSHRQFYLPFDTFNGKPKFNYTLQSTTSIAATQPKVETDKQDYHPAETAYITASGFTPGETVELQVLHLDAGADGEFGTADDVTVDPAQTGEGHEPWQVTDGGADDLDGQVNGSILTTWFVNPDDSANATFELTATGLSSGEEATHIFTDSVVLDLTNPSVQSNGSLQDTSGKTVLFSWTSYPGGSGATTSFLRLRADSGSTLERGYNTNGTQQFDTQSQGTQAILLSALPTITIDGTTYYEFRIDLNESGSNPQIDLTKLQIFQSNVANLTGYNTTTGQLAGLNPVINLNGTVKFNASLNSGGGVGDVLVYLPGNAFTGSPTSTYIYTYAEFQNADSGYEEFSYAPTTAIAPLADLSLTQTVSNNNLKVGDPVTFTLTLNNAGSANATGVKVKDLLPSGFSFTSATPSLGTYNSQTGIWNVGSITSGSNATLTLTGTVLNAASASAYTNVAEVVAADQFDPDSTVNNGVTTEDDYTSVLAPVVNLSLSKQFTSVTKEFDLDRNGTPDTFVANPGDNVSFTITVTNNSVAIANNVKITDDLTAVLPVGLDVVSINTGGGTNLDTSGGGDGNAQTIEVLFNSIAPGASKTITVNAKVSKNNFTPISWSSTIGTENPNTGQLNTALPEYHDTVLTGTLFLNLNVKKNANQADAKFGYLDFTSTAQVASVNGQTLSPGTITASSTLDVSTYALHAPLNNGAEFRAFGIDAIPNDANHVALTLNPDPGGTGDGTGGNNSDFLPPGVAGILNFAANWNKSSDPQYLAALNAWNALQADGDLSNTTDEQAVIDGLVKFISDFGVFRRDQYQGGAMSINNGTQTQTIEISDVEWGPTPTSSVSITVNDSGANVGSGGSFTDLQAALDSLNFANPTGVNVTLQDTSGDGKVSTILQKLGGYNFEKKWSIQTITVNSNVSQVTFTSGNGNAAVDFSFVTFVIPGATPTFILQGNNGTDSIIGTRFADNIQGLNGADTLSGGDGNDTINGGAGQDLITGGKGNDILTGGSSIDTFVFGPIFGNDTITDFEGQDKLDFSGLSISSGALDSNNDGVINGNDNLADLIGGNLVFNLTSLQGGTLTLTGVSSVNLSSVIL